MSGGHPSLFPDDGAFDGDGPTYGGAKVPNPTPQQPAPAERFDGPDVTPEDAARLSRQLARVRELMLDGAWRRLPEIAEVCEGREQSASARLRDLRKERFGGYTVDRRRVEGLRGVFEYRVVTPEVPR